MRGKNKALYSAPHNHVALFRAFTRLQSTQTMSDVNRVAAAAMEVASVERPLEDAQTSPSRGAGGLNSPAFARLTSPGTHWSLVWHIVVLGSQLRLIASTRRTCAELYDLLYHFVGD